MASSENSRESQIEKEVKDGDKIKRLVADAAKNKFDLNNLDPKAAFEVKGD